MGLDASVWCNCIETRKLHTPHPFPEFLTLDKSGRPDFNSDDMEKITAHDEWEYSSPCEHDQCRLVSHYLGNIDLVASLRESVNKLSNNAEAEYPVLWSEVIYSGTHCGDFLTVDEVRRLKVEIFNLKSHDFSSLNAQDIQYFQHFLEQMDELIEASLSVNKPISF